MGEDARTEHALDDAKTVCAEGIANAVIAALGLTDAYGRATDGMVNQLEAMQKEEDDD